MKKFIITLIALTSLQTVLPAAGQVSTGHSLTNNPGSQEYYRRFVALDIARETGFFWLDSTTGNLWQFDRSLARWENHGRQPGMTSGPKGTYTLLSDNRDGAYVLNTETGKGWWFDGSRWQIIDPADSANEDNDSIY